jgi:hypothetical protein
MSIVAQSLPPTASLRIAAAVAVMLMAVAARAGAQTATATLAARPIIVLPPRITFGSAPTNDSSVSQAAAEAPAKQAKPMFHVQGFVVMPGAIEWTEGLTLEGALLLAGGVKPEGAANRASVNRLDAQSNRMVDVDIKGDRSKFLIQRDDVINVPKKRL